MDFYVLGLGGLSDEDIGENNGYGQKNDEDNHTLTEPTLRLAHPFNATELILLGAAGSATRMVVVGHIEVKNEK